MRHHNDDGTQLSSVSYKADVVPHAPGGAPGGMIDEVEQDGEKETLAALAADPEREPLAKDSVEIESISGPHTVSYDNDAINRRSMTDSNLGIPINFARNALNQYTSGDGHGALNYDGNLNVSGYDGWAFVHDAEKRLLSVTGNGHSAQFVYDGLGRCVKRTIDGVTTVFTYDNWKPVAEWTGAGEFVAWNLYGAGADEILVRYQHQNPQGYLHYHLDAMGNVQFLLSDRPEPGLEKYTYDVFGKPTIIGWNGNVRPISNHGNRFLFTGREYLYTFGLYDYRHRIYHPGLGRFIETDPLGQQIEGAKLSTQQTALYALGGTAPEKFRSSELNLYRYCHNNPINHSDPMGTYAQGRGWTDETWKQFKAAQEYAAGVLERASKVIDPERFEKVFGPGTATPENMNQVSLTMQKMAVALRDDGTKGYVADAYSGSKRGIGGWGTVDGKNVLINTAHRALWGSPSMRAWTVGHEAGHNAGLTHSMENPAQKYANGNANDAYKTLPPALRLKNPDHFMDFAWGSP
jgi:RHS repeat-associated protein